MRAIVYYISLIFLLLCGGNYVYANTNQSSGTFSCSKNSFEKQHLKHKGSKHHDESIQSSDMELDEEFHLEDDLDCTNSNAILVNNQNLLNSWYITFSNQFIFKKLFESIKMLLG